jgi:hypothetical protein
MALTCFDDTHLHALNSFGLELSGKEEPCEKTKSHSDWV